MKKILVITPFFHPHIGGSERYMEELYAAVMSAHKDVQVDVLCYNTDKSVSRETYRRMTIYRIPCWQVITGQFCVPDPISLLRFLLSKQARSYDLIHCSTRFFDSSWWAPVYAKLTKRPIWLTDHCASFPAHPNRLIRYVAEVIDKVSGKLFLPLYDRVFVVSRQTQGFLKEKFGILSEVMHAGVDTSLFYPVTRERGKRMKAVYLGRMIMSKGIEDLLSVAKNMPEVDFVLAGPGKLGESLKSKAGKLGLKHIRILPALEREKAAKLLQGADIFVHPSRHSEGIPLVLLEAGACGLPIIATNTGGAAEVIGDGRGIVVPSGDREALEIAIRTLKADQELCKTFSRKIIAHVRQSFSWSKTSDKLYRHLFPQN